MAVRTPCNVRAAIGLGAILVARLGWLGAIAMFTARGLMPPVAAAILRGGRSPPATVTPLPRCPLLVAVALGGRSFHEVVDPRALRGDDHLGRGL